MLYPEEAFLAARGPFQRNENREVLRHLVDTWRNGKVSFCCFKKNCIKFHHNAEFYLSRVTPALFIAFGRYFENLCTYGVR